MQKHKNLLWLQVTPDHQASLSTDPVLQRHLLLVPVPGLLAIRMSDREAVLARLDKLGLSPRLVRL